MLRIDLFGQRLAVAASLLVTPLGASAASSVAADTQDVQHVMEAFHDAVYTNDGARLASLFIPEGSSWVSVLSDDAFAKLKEKRPGIAKVKVGNYQDFVRMVGSPKANLRPTRSNVVIHADGSVASVYFDYVFVIDGVEQNRGHETWQLVKGSDGWRISAIAYSSTPHLN